MASSAIAEASYTDLKVLNTRRTLFNELVNQLENNLSDRKEVLKINRIIENAIHWALVNGKNLILLYFEFVLI